ncbi:MAG: T9SS type A sorting domain-containing protein [Fluviicola sp.]
MKALATLLLFLTLALGLNAQNEFANHWHFGEGAYLDFSSGVPVSGNSPILAPEGSVSLSNNNGELLFFTNGGDIHQQSDGFVWDQNGNVMQNGELFDTAGCYSTIQPAFAVPFPESASEYYLFTLDCDEHSPTGIADYKGFRYSIIDMAQNGGLGAVTQKGVPVFGDTITRLSEGMTGTRHANGSDFWIVLHSFDQNTFYTFLISDTGITGPNIQTIGATESGQMKISHQGDKLVYGLGVYDFDNATGVISNYQSIPNGGTGAAFSMDGRYLYVTYDFNLSQYDLNATNIGASQQILFAGNPLSFEFPFGLQMGPDCKIYVQIFDKPYLGVINNPNVGGMGASFVKDQVSLQSGAAIQTGFPAFLDCDFNPCDGSGLEETAALDVHVSPNPGNGIFNVERSFEGPLQFELVNMLGEMSASGIVPENGTLQLDKQPSGIYLLKLFNEQGAALERVSIQSE